MAQLQTNTHDVLLRNAELLTGKVALLGVSEPALLAHCPQPGLAMSEHAGVYEQLCQHANWQACFGYQCNEQDAGGDRKSTRLNSSHVRISYAVFCLKKKNACHTGVKVGRRRVEKVG